MFPLDERAAVCGFEAEIDGVVTKGVVQEKEQARDTYHQAVAQGDGAQLLEQKRADVFELVRPRASRRATHAGAEGRQPAAGPARHHHHHVRADAGVAA